MSTILNVRGTSGSGKSFPVSQLIAISDNDQEIIGDGGKVIAHYIDIGGYQIYAIGSYRRVCGGTDTIRTQDEICDLIRFYSQHGDVIVEGLIMSHIYARYRDLADEMAMEGHKFIFAYLNTPIHICINRVIQRRRERAESRNREMKPLNTHNTVKQYFTTWKTYTKAKRDGYNAIVLDWEGDVVGELIQILTLENTIYDRH